MLRVGLVGGEEDLMVVAKAGISDNVDECDGSDTTARSSAELLCSGRDLWNDCAFVVSNRSDFASDFPIGRSETKLSVRFCVIRESKRLASGSTRSIRQPLHAALDSRECMNTV